MLKFLATGRTLGLVVIVCATGLMLGAGCPVSGLPDGGGNQAAVTNPAAPTLRFTQPTARADVPVGAVVGLQWTDTHPAGPATVRLFWDYDGQANTGDETSITVLSEGAGVNGGSYAWNTTGMATGKYRIAATIDDHVNSPVTVYLAYEVVIRPKTPSGQEPTLSLVQPATPVQVVTGESVMIRWDVTDPTAQDKLYLYYDVDLVPNNLNEVLIDVPGTGTGQLGSNDFGWTIPSSLAAGTYYIVGRLSDGVHPDIFAYAPGSVLVSVFGSTRATRELSQIGVAFAGVVFDGYQPYAHLGEVMTGGMDFDGDTYSDFILVAPKSYSPQLPTREAPLNRTGVGEAYLIYSRGINGRWPQQGKPFSVETVGTFNLEGVKFIGPDFSTSTSGIQEVQLIGDRDHDDRPEIIFGIPDLNAVIEDQQDYDPLDSNGIHGSSPPAPPGWPPGMYYYQTDGWQVFSTNPDGGTNDWLVPGQLRTGEIIFVSSQSEGTIRNRFVELDQVGGRAIIPALPLVEPCFGMRVYPLPFSDTSLWGSQLATCDLWGNFWPFILVARPMDDGGAGSVRAMPSLSMDFVFSGWTTLPPDLGAWWTTQPKCYTFPGADTSPPTDDPDRMPWWPSVEWTWFMDPEIHPPAPVPDPDFFNIMTSDGTVGGSGQMGHPTDLKDFDGDTVGDLAVSSPYASPQGGTVSEAGTAYIVYGSNAFRGADVSQFAQSIVRGYELAGTEAGEHLGFRMAGPGDINGDGYADWLLAAPNRSWSGRDHCGAVVLVYGKPHLYGSNTVDDIVPNQMGAIIYGANGDDHLGTYMVSVGDMDRDNYPDFVVSAPDYSAPGKPKCGAVYVIYGGPHLVGEFDIGDIGTPALPGKMYLGPEANAAIGPVAPAGDTDNDYYADFLIGYPGATPAPGLTEAGRAWLIYGSLRTAP
jgi:hypothetical protein